MQFWQSSNFNALIYSSIWELNIKEEIDENKAFNALISKNFDSDLSQSTVLLLDSNTQQLSDYNKMWALFRGIGIFESLKMIKLNLRKIEQFGYDYIIRMHDDERQYELFEWNYKERWCSSLIFQKINTLNHTRYKLIRFKSSHSHSPQNLRKQYQFTNFDEGYSSLSYNIKIESSDLGSLNEINNGMYNVLQIMALIKSWFIIILN